MSWAETHGAFLHPRVEIYQDDVTKFSMRVRKNGTTNGSSVQLRAGETILSCPTSMTLSYLNALTDGPLESSRSEKRTSTAFPASFMEINPPHVIGRFYLIQQYLEGIASAWSAYIETLPQPEHLASWCLPAFWPSEDAALLDRTNAAGSIEEMQGNVTAEFKKARKLLKELDYPGWEAYTRVLYNWAFCIFTSRSFRPSLVLSAEKQQQVAMLLPVECQLDDFSVLLPLFDIPNHSPTAMATWDAAADPAGVHFRIEQDYGPGEQIFNNYGMKTNSELLLGYGFVLPETDGLHNDYVHLRKRTQVEVEDPAVGDDAGNDIRDFLISLRPLSHPSSVIGRSRQFAVPDGCGPLAATFDYFEDALLWDLCFHLATPDEKTAMGPVEDGAVPDLLELRRQQRLALSKALRTEPLPELLDLSRRVKEALVAKLGLDYERLLESEVEADGGSTPNQRLALQYRKQYAKVLANAITALDPNIALPR